LDDRRNQETAWKRMHTALVSFEARFGHCRVPKGILVEGVDVARWIVKQRSLHRRGAILPERRELLKSIPSWSFAPRDVDFAEQVDLFVERSTARPLTSDERSQSSTWATNLRMRREALQAKGTDYSAERLAAMDALPGWQWDPRGAEFGRKVDVLKAHVDQTGRSVAQIKQRDSWNGKPLGAWLNTWRTHPDRLSPEQRRLLEDLPGWTWKPRDDGWDGRLAQLEVFATEHGHARPSVNSADEDEQALARWKRNNKNRRRSRSDPRTAQLRKLLARYGETL
jgi:hypothetical protein